jgi:hypothetical protein
MDKEKTMKSIALGATRAKCIMQDAAPGVPIAALRGRAG